MSTLLAQVADQHFQYTPRPLHIPAKNPVRPHKKCPTCDGARDRSAIMCRECRWLARRSPIDPAVYIVAGCRCRMLPLTQNMYAIVNEHHYEFLLLWHWHAWWSRDTRSWYAKSKHRINGVLRVISIHHILFSVLPHVIYDHKNRRTLDNRMENLRPSSKITNGYNRGLVSNNTSGFKCVSWRKDRQLWVAYITVNRKRIHIGFFAQKEDAARAYDRKAIEMHGEFACLNFPREDYL